MTPQATLFRSRALRREPAVASVTPREDARWTRPIFRPPPLDVHPTRPEFPYSGTIHRTELLSGKPGQNSAAR